MQDSYKCSTWKYSFTVIVILELIIIFTKVWSTLERLEISFYRSYSGSYQLYDFNGVDNSLTFEITCHIDKRWSHETNKNNYYINDDVEYYEQYK